MLLERFVSNAQPCCHQQLLYRIMEDCMDSLIIVHGVQKKNRRGGRTFRLACINVRRQQTYKIVHEENSVEQLQRIGYDYMDAHYFSKS